MSVEWGECGEPYTLETERARLRGENADLRMIIERMQQDEILVGIARDAQWIPCSERMPEAGRVVPVTCRVDGKPSFVEVARRDEKGWSAQLRGMMVADIWTYNVAVTAWLDVEPWRGDE